MVFWPRRSPKVSGASADRSDMGQSPLERSPGVVDIAAAEPVATRGDRIEHDLLGRALRARSADVVRICQLKYIAQSPYDPFESMSQIRLSDVASAGVT